MAAIRSLTHPGPGLVLAALAFLFPAGALRHEEDHAMEELMADAAAAGEEMPGGPKDPIMDYLVHRCMEQRASDWLELHKRLGLPVPAGPESGESVAELVDRRVEVMDAQEERKAGRGKLASLAHWDRFSSHAKAWKEEMEAIDTDLLAWGFSYEAAHLRCDEGSNDESYECMKESVPRCRNCPSDPELVSNVAVRIDLKDFLAHPAAEPVKKDLQARVKAIDRIFRDKYYSWKDHKKSCRNEMLNERKEIELRIKAELSAGGKDEDDVCKEKPDKMCPEGTYVTTKRRRDMIKGATAATATYIIGKTVITPLGALAGTAAAGPAGSVPGALTAGMVSSWLVIGAAYWGSLGPRECGCFMRDCAFDKEAGVCRMKNNDESPSKNPFAIALPMSGMKCELKYKSTDECVATACGVEDFKPALDNGLFGTVGNMTTGSYNCLSTTGSQSGALTLSMSLPGSKANSIEERVKIFKELAPVEANPTDVEATPAPVEATPAPVEAKPTDDEASPRDA